MLVEVGQIVQDAIVSGNTDGMKEEAVKVADELNYAYTKTGDLISYYRVLTEDINESETAQLMADMLMNSGMGDFALITHTDVKDGIANEKGASGNLYADVINDQQILVINADREYCVTTMQLTGAEVKDLLTNGKLIKGTGDLEGKQTYFDYYWSGIDVTMNNVKIKSVKLNGSELEDNTTYTVVFSENDYPEEYAEKSVVSENLVSENMIGYMEKNPEISAPEVLRK